MDREWQEYEGMGKSTQEEYQKERKGDSGSREERSSSFHLERQLHLSLLTHTGFRAPLRAIFKVFEVLAPLYHACFKSPLPTVYSSSLRFPNFHKIWFPNKQLQKIESLGKIGELLSKV